MNLLWGDSDDCGRKSRNCAHSNQRLGRERRGSPRGSTGILGATVLLFPSLTNLQCQLWPWCQEITSVQTVCLVSKLSQNACAHGRVSANEVEEGTPNILYSIKTMRKFERKKSSDFFLLQNSGDHPKTWGNLRNINHQESGQILMRTVGVEDFPPATALSPTLHFQISLVTE
jgi:hypothetical protein